MTVPEVRGDRRRFVWLPEHVRVLPAAGRAAPTAPFARDPGDADLILEEEIAGLTREELLGILFDAGIEAGDPTEDAPFAFNPSEAREPAGSEGGGRWTSGGVGAGVPVEPGDVEARAQDKSPRLIEPPDPAMHPGKVAAIAARMEEAGAWVGRPVLVAKHPTGSNDKSLQAWTGSHRLAAADQAGVDARVVRVDEDSLADALEAAGYDRDTHPGDLDDEQKVEVFDRLNDPVASYLMRQENELGGTGEDAAFAFNPDQLRDDAGRWAEQGGAPLAETHARWEEEDDAREKRQEDEREALEDARQAEASALGKVRDREDAATEKKRDREDDAVSRARDREDAQEEAKSDRAAQRAKDREDAASFAREKVTPTYREWARLDREYGPGSKESQQAWERHERATDRPREDARLQAVHERIDRNAEEYMQEWRADREKAHQAEDAARREARAAEDAATAARRRAEDAAARERHDRETAALAARHEAEDAAVYDARRQEHPVAHAAHYQTGDAPFYDPSQPRHPAGSSVGGRWVGGVAVGTQDARDAAHQAVRDFAAGKGPLAVRDAHAIAMHLAKLTVAQIHALKASLGIKASAPNKAALVAKIAGRIRALRGQATAVAPPPAPVTPTPAPTPPPPGPAPVTAVPPQAARPPSLARALASAAVTEKVRVLADSFDRREGLRRRAEEAEAALRDFWDARKAKGVKDPYKLGKRDQARFDELRRQDRDAQVAVSEDRYAHRGRLVKLLGVREPLSLPYTFAQGWPDANFDNYDRIEIGVAHGFVISVVEGAGVGVPPVSVVAYRGGARADYSRHDGQVGLPGGKGYGTGEATAHELGHHLEYHLPGAREAAVEFLGYRVGTEAPRKMNEVSGSASYSESEAGRKDRFDSVFEGPAAYYVGKDVGPTNSTELVSMGVEQLYRDAALFAKKDPEYCAWLLGVLSAGPPGGVKT